LIAALDKSPTPAEYKALARILAQCTWSLTPNLEALDGLFCALIVGPDVVLPSEYLPLVLGPSTHFESLEDVKRVLPLLMRHWNTIALTLEHGDIYDLSLLKRWCRDRADRCRR
jgi:yecA family protein